MSNNEEFGRIRRLGFGNKPTLNGDLGTFCTFAFSPIVHKSGTLTVIVSSCYDDVFHVQIGYIVFRLKQCGLTWPPTSWFNENGTDIFMFYLIEEVYKVHHF